MEKNIERIYVCTSKNAKLFRIYRLQTGDVEKRKVLEVFNTDLEKKIEDENKIENYNENSLIQDIPYKISLDSIKEDSYLKEFKFNIDKILSKNPADDIRIIQFEKIKNNSKNNEIKNFEENEGIKFLIIEFSNSLVFLEVSTNSVLKKRSILSVSITSDTLVFDVPKGIQIPTAVTARIDKISKNLFVYDVNRFEKMLTLNENVKEKSRQTINKFKSGEYKISEENYIFIGLDDESVEQSLFMSARAVRRLSKYSGEKSDHYKIEQIKKAVGKLSKDIQVYFDDEKKEIKVTNESTKTFVAIIHNSIVERLISGDIEITI
ncbi:hypothetical protein BG261_06420 [Floricoccus tropicus]|uniref:DUF4868 domain-containing protein n=1 Tax=Floricoccus tropicus TaxID=1859473 RepID=A0A1E8GK13_9LACT|nr:hypothetical protein [Floricoccus tropicus]OFI48527.1 hypothetical protein BG261_06420 [Floricoccus tropicus]